MTSSMDSQIVDIPLTTENLNSYDQEEQEQLKKINMAFDIDINKYDTVHLQQMNMYIYIYMYRLAPGLGTTWDGVGG